MDKEMMKKIKEAKEIFKDASNGVLLNLFAEYARKEGEFRVTKEGNYEEIEVCYYATWELLGERLATWELLGERLEKGVS